MKSLTLIALLFTGSAMAAELPFWYTNTTQQLSGSWSTYQYGNVGKHRYEGQTWGDYSDPVQYSSGTVNGRRFDCTTLNTGVIRSTSCR